MASQMVIPSSNDTLFIRGFSSRHHVDEIRDYFAREGGRNTVEFFKETAMGDQLFIALKFESKSVAKDVLNRLDGCEVLGDRITMSWYKDIRKARSMEQYRRPSQNQNWQQDRYDYRGGYNRGRGGYNQRGQRGGTGGGWYQRGNDYGDGGNRPRRYTRSSSHSRSRSSGRSRSRSGSRSSSRDRASRSRSRESRERNRKRHRSASDASSNHRSNRKNKTRDASSSRSPDANRGSSRSDSDSQAQSEQAANKKSKVVGKKANDSGNAERQDSKTRELESNAEAEVEQSEANDIANDDNLSPQPVPPPGGNAGKSGRAIRSTVTTVERTVAVSKRAKVPADDSTTEASSVTDISPQTANPNKKPTAAETAKETLKAKKLKEERRRLYEDPLSDDDFIAKVQTSRKFPSESDDYLFERPKNRAGKEAINDVEPESPPDFTLEDVVAVNQTKRKSVNVAKKAGMNPSKDFDPFDDDDEAMIVEPVKRRRQLVAGGGDELPRSSGERAGRSLAAGRRPAASGGRDVGAVGMTYEKMQLVRQKKEDIEKAYRQDCETFATVTKMLISKDPSLEQKIQDSLRDNLKDIGQRCIQELRTFIERLKEEEIEDD